MATDAQAPISMVDGWLVTEIQDRECLDNMLAGRRARASNGVSRTAGWLSPIGSPLLFACG